MWGCAAAIPIDRLIAAARMAPTDIPDLGLILATSPKTLQALESLALDRVEKKYLRFYDRAWLYDLLRRLTPAVNDRDRARLRDILKRGTLFSGAPVLALAVADPKRPSAEANCHSALHNMSLMAETMGLGTCLLGLSQFPLSSLRRSRKSLEIPKSKNILGVLLLGYPEVETPLRAAILPLDGAHPAEYE